jgi:hypothetical protein
MLEANREQIKSDLCWGSTHSLLIMLAGSTTDTFRPIAFMHIGHMIRMRAKS